MQISGATEQINPAWSLQTSFKKIQVPGCHPKAVESKPLGMEPKNLYVFKVHQMMGVHSSLEPWLFKTHRHTLSCPIRS